MERLPLHRIAPARLVWIVLAASGALTLALAWDLTYWQDTWSILINRRDLTAEALFHPHNEHIVVIPVLIEQLLLRVFGMTSAMPEYVIFTASLLAVAYLLFLYVRRRAGDWLALFAAVLVLFLGPAWEVLLWPFEIGFSGSMLFGLAMLLALEREDRRGDVAACVFLVLSLGFSSLGVAFVAGAAVAILQGPRESWRRRAFLVVIPVLLFAAWYVGWGHEAESHLSLGNVLASPRYVAEAVAVALGALFGLGTDPTTDSPEPVWGRVLLVAAVALLAYRQYRRPGLHPGIWPIAAIAFSNWFLTAFNEFPGREPVASRYQYAGAIFIVMLLANLLRDVRFSRRGIVIAGIVTAVAVGPNLVVLEHGQDFLQKQTTLTRADTAAIEIAQRTVDPEFQLNPEVAGTPSLIDIFAGRYLEAVDEFGSPAYSEVELAAGPEEGRRQADIVLAQALPLGTRTNRGAFDGPGGGESCVAVPPGGGPASEVAVGPGLTRIKVPPGPRAELSLRRFAEGEYPVGTAGAPGDSVTILRVPRDESPRPWQLLVDAPQGAAICR